MTISASGRPPDPPLIDCTGQALFLTGAASGIGAATARLFAGAGARVAAFDIAAGPSESDYLWLHGDAASARDVDHAVAATVKAFGRIDHVVHCVGRTGSGPLVDMELADWNDQLAVNLTSAFLLAKAAAAPLRGSRGSLVLVGSPNGVHGGSILSGPAYAAAKAGLINLARYLAREWAPDVRVNCLVPGTVDTPMLDRLSPEQRSKLIESVPIGRLVTADEAASAIAFLCSAHAGAMTGSTMNVSGGRLMI